MIDDGNSFEDQPSNNESEFLSKINSIFEVITEKKIAMQYAEMSNNYGRVFTPSRQSARMKSAKLQMIEEE